jgi:hypothetical protein
MTDNLAPPPAAPSAPPPAAPPAAPPPPPPAPGGDPWFAKPELGLSQEARDYLAQKNYGGLEDAIKAKRVFDTLARDRNAMIAPDPAKLQEWDGWQRLGWVPEADKYQVPVAETFKDDPEYGKLHQTVTKAAHAAHLPLPMAKAVTDALAGEIQRINAADDAAIEQERQRLDASLRQKWGSNYDTNTEMAKRAMRATGLPVEQQDILDAIIGHAPLLEHFHRLGTMLGEDRLVANVNGGAGGFGMTPAAAKAELARQAADPEFVKSLSDPRHAMHQVNTEKRRQLFEAAAKA